MPDRHGPLRVIYEETFSLNEVEIPWEDFESNTPNDVLDRTTRGILNVSPLWLGEELSETERDAVLEAFGEEITVPEDEQAT